MAQLPQEFLTRMQDMLGDEFDAIFNFLRRTPHSRAACEY